jgi:eukaryotic-like serine/threonine-protein kinase
MPRRCSKSVRGCRQIISLLEKHPKPEPLNVYELACGYALIHGAAAAKGSDLTTADADDAAVQALAALRRALAAGYRDQDSLRKETALDSLRQRPDFAKLLAELEKESKASGK